MCLYSGRVLKSNGERELSDQQQKRTRQLILSMHTKTADFAATSVFELSSYTQPFHHSALLSDKKSGYRTQSILTVPIVAKKDVVGVIQV